MPLKNKHIGFAITDSQYTIDKVILSLKKLKETGAELTTILADSILSRANHSTQKLVNKIRNMIEKPIINSVLARDSFEDNKLLDLLIIAPCSGETLAKIAEGTNDDTVVKTALLQLKHDKPILIAIATNDKIGINTKNLGYLLNSKNIYFVPFCQANPRANTDTIFMARFDLLNEAAEFALEKKQIEPVLLEYSGI